MMFKHKIQNNLLLIFLLIVTFFKTYSLHLNYKYPYHHDEWQHLALAQQAADSGYNKQYNPYLNEPNPHFDLESGFHLFLATLILMVDLNPVTSYQYLAAIFSVLSAYSIFLCTFRLTKKFLIGIISVMVFISLKSNVNILGTDYFVPLTMAIPFMFLYIYLYLNSLQKKDTNMFFTALIVILILFLIHPPSAVILILPTLFESLYHLKFLKSRLLRVAPFLGVFSIIILWLIWKGNLFKTINYVSYLLYFEPGWGKLEVTYFLPLLYGLINTSFAIIGFIMSYKSKLRFFTFFAFISVGMTSLFNIRGFTFIIPYSRVIHYAMLAMIPLTAIGFYKFSQIIKSNIKVRGIEILVILIFSILIIISRYELDSQYKYYEKEIITQDDYNALLWLKNNFGQQNIVLTSYHMTSAVYPISKNQVISVVPAQVSGGYTEENLKFFHVDCNNKKEILNITKPDCVLSETILKCGFLKKIYSKNPFIYQVI